MPITIFLLRHGQDVDNAKGIMNGRYNSPLTELGKKQAERAATKIAKEKMAAIFSSPLLRAKQTADIIAKKHGLAVQIDERLLERDFGKLTGQPHAELKKYCKNTITVRNNIYILDGRGVERFQEVLRRAKSFINYLKENYPNKKIIIVCHNDIAKMIQAVVWQKDINDTLKNSPFLANASVTKLLLK
jgi:broad specificity phosphatase PhoE